MAVGNSTTEELERAKALLRKLTETVRVACDEGLGPPDEVVREFVHFVPEAAREWWAKP